MPPVQRIAHRSQLNIPDQSSAKQHVMGARTLGALGIIRLAGLFLITGGVLGESIKLTGAAYRAVSRDGWSEGLVGLSRHYLANVSLVLSSDGIGAELGPAANTLAFAVFVLALFAIAAVASWMLVRSLREMLSSH